MKRFSLLLVFMLVFALASAVSAGEFEAVGGCTSNNFDSTLNYSPDEDFNLDIGLKTLNGSGYYLGARYFMDNNLGFGIGYDYVKVPLTLSLGLVSEYELDLQGTLSSELSGPYGEVVYKLNDYVTFSGAVAFYNFVNKLSYAIEETYDGESDGDSDEMTFVKGAGTGYMVGAELNYPFYDNFSIVSSVGYRTVTVDLNEYNTELFSGGEGFAELEDWQLSMKGLKFGVGLSYNF